MKMMNKEEFMKCLPGTVYSKYDPDVPEGLEVLFNTYPDIDDFASEDLIDNIDFNRRLEMHDQMKTYGRSLPVPVDFDNSCRDGRCWDGCYLVWEKSDIEALIAKLNNSIKKVEEHYATTPAGGDPNFEILDTVKEAERLSTETDSRPMGKTLREVLKEREEYLAKNITIDLSQSSEDKRDSDRWERMRLEVSDKNDPSPFERGNA